MCRWVFQPRRNLNPGSGQERGLDAQEEWEVTQGDQLDLEFKRLLPKLVLEAKTKEHNHGGVVCTWNMIVQIAEKVLQDHTGVQRGQRLEPRA